jgi:hypothetical protein
MYRCAYQLKPTYHIYSILTRQTKRHSVIEAYNRDPKDLQSNPLNVPDKNGFPHVEGVHRICSRKNCLSKECLSPPCENVVEETSVLHFTSMIDDENLPASEKPYKEVHLLNESENFKGQPKAQGVAKYKMKIPADTAKMTKNEKAGAFIEKHVDKVHDIVKNKS